MRIMTIHAIHLPFQHRMTLRQAKLGMLRLMAVQTRLRILAGIVNEDAFSTAGLNVFASGSVARFATANLSEPGLFLEKARVNAAGKQSRNLPVTFGAFWIADEMRPLNTRRNYNGIRQRKTRNKKQQSCQPSADHNQVNRQPLPPSAE